MLRKQKYSVLAVSNQYNSLINYLTLFTHRCSENARTVYLKEGHWGGVVNGRLVTYYCPPNYCRCVTEGDLPGCLFNPDHIDYQCDHNRTGVLCGQCKNGLSVGLRLVQQHLLLQRFSYRTKAKFSVWPSK